MQLKNVYEQKIGFVILHYIAIEDTKKCIESIIEVMKGKGIEYEIVIVDNFSNNGTAEILKEIYQKNKQIHICINTKNLGFAKGNNVGFLYAKNNLKCSFIVLMNNDTYIKQNDFAKKIIDEYEQTKFAVMGPKIILKDGTINPIRNLLPTKKQLKHSIIMDYMKVFLLTVRLNNMYKKLNLIQNKKQNEKKKLNVNEMSEDIILHGCCLIFSPCYIEKFDGIDERTFLYCEEELLYIRILKNNLNSMYNPNLEIFHTEDVSTKAINKNDRKRDLFKYKNQIKSKRILYKELKNMEEQNDKKNNKKTIK